ncbi:copper resistance CopC/CopD family protein [Nocardioides sp.]|uniref:copper resistance CopC/CopD family protein n=1 Tax=Nocardioides sp. TaxID=35761 RepID=UPI0035689BA7
MTSLRQTLSLLVVAGLLGILAGVGFGGPASAHSELVRSDPPDSGRVEVGRTDISLWFAQAIEPRGSRFLLHTVDGLAIEVAVEPGSDGRDGFLRLQTPPLERGIYVLDWHALSSEDGHTSSGSVLFGAGIRPDAFPSAASSWPGWPTLISRAVDLLAISIAIGVVVVTGRVLDRTQHGRAATARALRIGSWACWFGVVSALVTPFARTPRAREPVGSWLDASLETLLGTRWGALWIVHTLCLLVAGVALASLARRRGARWPRPLTGSALVVLAAVDAAAGHSADLARDPQLAIVASAAHLVAVGCWAGGLLVLVLCLWRAMTSGEPARVALAETWRAFSPLAAFSSMILLATGVYLAGRQVPDFEAATSTMYGLATLGKAGAIVVVLSVAAGTTLLVHPRLAAALAGLLSRPTGWTPVPRRRFAHLVLGELLVLTVALGLAALMTSAPTARERARTEQLTAPRTATVDGLFVSFEEVAAGAGESRIIVRTRAVTRPEPGPVTGVEVLLAGPDRRGRTETLRQIETGRFEGTTAAPEPGEWEAWITIERRGAGTAAAYVTWSVAPPEARVIGGLERVSTLLALLITLGLAAVGATLVLRRIRRRPGRCEPSPGEPPERPSEPRRDAAEVGVK